MFVFTNEYDIISNPLYQLDSRLIQELLVICSKISINILFLWVSGR